MPQGPIPVLITNSSAYGRSWFVNETTGNDSNNGSTVAPFKTLDAALDAATASNNDVVYMIGTQHRTTTLTWNKAGVSLVGLAAPSDNDRARISITGSAVFSPLVDVTAQGCSFVNLGTFHGFADASAQICWIEEGGRNFYSNVQFLGGGNATAAAQAGMRSLVVGGSGENLMIGCTAGLDTVVRATNANATMEFVNGTPRNRFIQMVFQALISDTADVHIHVGASGIDRYAFFDEPVFMNAVESTGSLMSAAITADNAAGGAVVLRRPISLGATAIATAGPVYADSGALGPTTYGIAVKQT